VCYSWLWKRIYNTAEHLLEQCGDGNIEDGYVLLFDVVDANDQDKILYDCWLYLFDETANVFYHRHNKRCKRWHVAIIF
jgi:hypothetical protein